MKPLIITKFLSIVCVLFSGYTFAVVQHSEDSSIVGKVFGDTICFNSDGAILELSECDGSVNDEGMVTSVGNPIWKWKGTSPSGINGCGVTAVNPVTSATCPFYLNSNFADCPFEKYVLIQTTQSGHYWAIKANSPCSAVATPERAGLVPCRKTDAFDTVNGCYAASPSEISIEGGFIKLDTSIAPPPEEHCLEIAHEGRMVVDSLNGILYICTEAGWEPITTDTIP